MSPTTATMEATTVESTSEARPAARGKAPNISTVIEAAKCAGARSRLEVRGRRPAECRTSAARSGSAERVAMVEVDAIEISVVEIIVIEVVAIDDRSTVRDVGVVVINH